MPWATRGQWEHVGHARHEAGSEGRLDAPRQPPPGEAASPVASGSAAASGGRLVPLLLAFAFLFQAGWFVSSQSLTMDEPLHLYAGLEAWKRGEFKRFADHPPLARLLLALPLLALKDYAWSDLEAGRFPPQPETSAWRARSINVVLGLLLGGLIFAEARRLYGEAGARLALALYAFSPPIVAHYSLATTDGAGTLSIFASALLLARWGRGPTRRISVMLGLALGMMLASKHYALPLCAVALGAMLSRGRRRGVLESGGRDWSSAALAAGLAFFVVWGCHFFHVTVFTARDGRLTAFFPVSAQRVERPFRLPFNLTIKLPVPAAEYLSGVRTIARLVYSDLEGGRSFFLGEIPSGSGPALYFPTAIALKWPTLVLAMAALGSWRLLRTPGTRSRNLGLLFLFPAVFASLAFAGKFHIGDRHMLPLYPFLILLAGGVMAERGVKRRLTLAIVAVGLNAADALRYIPDYLSYFNVFVPPAESHLLLTDSSLDWGQGLLALRRYEGEHPAESVRLAYFGPVDPSVYGIRALPLKEGERACGTLIVSATHLSGQALRDPTSYRWLLAHRRKALLNHSLHVFDVPCLAAPP